MAERQPIRGPIESASVPTAVFHDAQQLGISDDDLHELRVRIPVDLHRQLLSLKVLRGRSLAETVSLALDIYFAERSAEAERETEDASS